MAIQSINPATGEVIAEFPAMTKAEVDGILEAAQQTYRQWRQTSMAERAALMHAAGAYLRQQKAQFAAMITAEMGKPIGEAEGDLGEQIAVNRTADLDRVRIGN